MRQYATLRPNRSPTVSDPRLDGIGHALEQLYAPVLDEGLPEAWLRLLGPGPGRAGEARARGRDDAGEPAGEA